MTIWYVIAGILVLVGLAGTILPVLPGLPLVFLGMLLAAWAGGFAQVGVGTLVALGVLTLLSVAVDFWAAAVGARRVGASKLAIIGAVVASLLFEGAKEGFAIYVRNVPGYNVLYGAFVSVPFFLIWIYVSWLVVLFGAELTAALGNWKRGDQEGAT